MDLIFIAGRILFGGLFLLAGAALLAERHERAELAARKGVPAAPVAVVLAGLLAFAAGAMLVLGLWTDLGALLVVAFLVPVSPAIHDFWRVSDPAEKHVELAAFLTNVALVGAALMLFSFVNQAQDARASLTAPMFDRW